MMNRALLFALVVLLSTIPAGAEPLVPGALEPAQPDTFDSVTAVLYVPGCSDSGPRIVDSQVVWDDFEIQINVEVLEDFGCSGPGAVKTEVPMEFLLGRRSPGHHRVIHTRQLVPFGDPELQEVLEFSISGEPCRFGEEPGATLVVPYFEVDLENPEGKTTALSINNADDEPALARVVLWTDWAVPVLTFDLYLKGNDVQTLNLRQILDGGMLPETGAELDPVEFPGCSAPLAQPTLNAAARQRLRALLSGGPDPDDGLCYGLSHPGRAVGFLTVDTVRSCADFSQGPTDSGFFDPDSGVAADRNVLWGDIVYLDPRNNSAQGLRAVALPALETEEGRPTFYRQGSRRNPLPTGYRSRYFDGGAFQGGSEMILFAPSFGSAEGTSCEDPTFPVPGLFPDFLQAQFRSAGEAGGELKFSATYNLPAVTSKLNLEDVDLQLEDPFGLLAVSFWWTTAAPITPPSGRIQGWVAPVLRAGDRFSVGLEAMPTVTLCDPVSKGP